MTDGGLSLQEVAGSIYHHDAVRFYLYMIPGSSSNNSNRTDVIGGPSKTRHTVHIMGNSLDNNNSLNESGGKFNGHEELWDKLAKRSETNIIEVCDKLFARYCK